MARRGFIRQVLGKLIDEIKLSVNSLKHGLILTVTTLVRGDLRSSFMRGSRDITWISCSLMDEKRLCTKQT